MWLAKLNRMMTELPDKYLVPQPFDALAVDGAKLVGQLSEEEKRLLGVCYQLGAKMELEAEAHNALYGNPDHIMTELCLRHKIQECLVQGDLSLICGILCKSIAERLSLFESDFLYDGFDIYAIELPDITDIKDSYSDDSDVDLSRPIDPSEKLN